MITISELARFAGVTVKAVRHYHARGLLPEPERDESGYRRYDADAAVELIRIKTLSDAGVPLARVKELLAADEDDFAAAVADIDAELRRTIRRLQAHRRRVAELANGDALALPPVVLGYLQLLGDYGMSRRMIGIERDGWILLCAHSPDRVPGWIRLKTESLGDPAYREAYRMLDEAWDWPADDPRLPALADVMLAAVPATETVAEPDMPTPEEFDRTINDLLASQATNTVPAWRRLTQLLAERGLLGWTDVDSAGATPARPER